MANFHDQYWLDNQYKVTVQPYADWIRSCVFIRRIVPYLSGTEIRFTVSVKPTQDANQEERLSYAWVLWYGSQRDKFIVNKDTGYINVKPKETSKTMIYLGDIVDISQYVFAMKFSREGEDSNTYKRLASFSVFERDKFYWPIITTIAGAILGILLGILATLFIQLIS